MAHKKTAIKGFFREIEVGHAARGRNTLARWMRTHHDELLAGIDGKPIDWELYINAFARRGLKDADGNSPTKATASRTWYRIRAAVAIEQARKQAQAVMPALAPGEIAAGVRSLVPPTPSVAAPAIDPPRPRMTLDIRPATPRTDATAGPTLDGLSSTPMPSRPLPVDAPVSSTPGHPDDTAAEQVRRLLGQMNARTVPLPKIVP